MSSFNRFCVVVFTLLLSVLIPAHGEETTAPSGDAALITATRFAASIDTAPVNVTVITSADITHSQVTTLAEAIEQLGGVQVQSLFGISGADTKVDLSGFGATGGQNTLILLNGRRLNDLDLSDANLAAIPLRSVERIEVVRGSSAVLYGDNAVGGVINIVTQSGFSGPSASVNARIGSFGTRELGAQARYAGAHDAIFFTANRLQSDGYRDYNDTTNTSILTEYTHQMDTASYGGRLYASHGDAKLPGALKEAAYKSDRTAAGFKMDTDERQVGVDLFFSSASLAGEFSGRSKHQESSSAFGDTEADLKTWSLTPRWHGEVDSHAYIAGLDLYRSTLDAAGTIGDATDATRNSFAIYGSDRYTLTSVIALNFGLRVQRVDLEMNNSSSFTGVAQDDSQDTRAAWDLAFQLRYGDGARGHVRMASAFRFPVLDENWSYLTGDFVPLEPQTSRHFEAGGSFPFGESARLDLSMFRMLVNHEIGYDAVNGVNANLDPTQHHGTDISIKTAPTADWSLRITHSFRDGEFRSGALKGKTIPDVPDQKLSVGNTLNAHELGRFTLDVAYTGARYFASDNENDGKKMAGYTLLNAGWLHEIPYGQVRIGINNVTDVKTADSGVYYYDFDTFSYGYAYYPLPERSFSVALDASF